MIFSHHLIQKRFQDKRGRTMQRVAVSLIKPESLQGMRLTQTLNWFQILFDLLQSLTYST